MWGTPGFGNERGLSLVEVLVMVLLVSLILIAVPASFRSATQIWEKGNRHNEVMQNALTGMEELTRELKQAKEIIAVSGSADPIGFIEFMYQDGVDDEDEKVYKYQRYGFDDDYLQYATSNDEDTILSDNLKPLAGPLNNLSFTCYKEYQLPAAPDELDQIREIHVNMITYDEFGKVNPIPLSARVYLRTWIQHTVLEDFAIFGDDGVTLGDQGIFVGYNVEPSNVGANADIYFGQHTSVYGELHNGLSSDLNFNNNPNDVNYDPDNCYGYDEFILMPCATDFDDSQWWNGIDPPWSPPADVLDYQGDVTVEHDEEMDLIPGVYGDLVLNNNAIINLVAGTYRFNSITGKNDVAIRVNVSGGDVRVFVDKQVILGNTLDSSTSLMELVDGGGAEHVYFETHYGLAEEDDDEEPAWSMGQNALWYGGIYAPYGDIDISDGVIFGQLISGGTIEVHGGEPAQIDTPVSGTMVDFVLSNHLDDYGYACDPY